MKRPLLSRSGHLFGSGLVPVLVLLAALCRGAAALCPESCTCREIGTATNGDPGLDVHCWGRPLLPIPLEDLPPTRVLKLNLTQCHLGSFQHTAWPKLSVLKVLDLSWNLIPSSLMEIGVTVPNLLSLNVSGNALESLSFPLPKSLKVLVASHNVLPSLNCGDLMNIPDVETVCLDFNVIQNVSNSEGKKLHKLRTLSLSHNKITTLGREFSSCFSSTEYLTLAGNKVRQITAGMFQHFVTLQYLDLSNNLIISVANKAFQHLGSLRYLSLSGNRLQQLSFSLPLLEWVDLSYNFIHTVSESQTQSLYLHEVFLIGSNPLHCNCSLVPLKELYDTREYQVNFLSVNRSKFVPVCASPPHLAGESWDVLGDAVFECASAGSGTQQPVELGPRLSGRDAPFVRAVDITTSSITLKWTVLQDPGVSVEKQLTSIHIHPFGRKSLLRSFTVPWTKGVYTLESLSPATSYVVCMDVSHVSTENSVPKHSSHCLELVTETEDSLASYSGWGLLSFLVTGIVIAMTSALLLSPQFRCLILQYWNNFQNNCFVWNKSVDDPFHAKSAATKTPCDKNQDTGSVYSDKQDVQ